MAIEPFLGTRAQLGFLGTVVLQGVAVLALVAISFGLIESNVSTAHGDLKTLPCYLALFGFAVLYELIITLDALKLRNFIEIVGINIFHTGMIVFGALQVQQTHTALVTNPGGSCDGEGYVTCSGPHSLWHLVRIFIIIAPCILGASLLVMVYFTWKLYHEFGWVVFHVVGANYQMKTMFQWYQILVCLLKFDFFCFTSLTMLLLILVISNDRAEFVITIVAIPVVLVLLFGCVQAVRKEIKWLMSCSLVLMLGAQAYFLYKFARLWMPESRELYATTRGTVATITIVSFLMLFSTFAVGVRCFMDFDKGLREAKEIDTKFDRPLSSYSAKEAGIIAPGTPPATPGMTQRNSSYAGGSVLATRVSIE